MSSAARISSGAEAFVIGGRSNVLESVDVRMLKMVRLVLAAAALLIIFIDPSEPDRFVAVTYAALFLYTAYSAVLYVLARRESRLLPLRYSHWIDIGWYLVFISLSSGTNSIFFFFFFFPIIVSSFRWGYETGLRVTLVSTCLFVVVGYFSTPAGAAITWNRFLLRPIYLLALGYMMAYWGGSEVRLKNRLALLREVNELSNPRFGVGPTVSSMMRRVVAFYEADSCMLIVRDPDSMKFHLRRVHRDGREEATAIPDDLAMQFLNPPPGLAVIYDRRGGWNRRERFRSLDLSDEAGDEIGREECRKLAALFDADAFASVPLRRRGESLGRVFLLGGALPVERSEMEFLLQIVEQATPVINNIQLLDRLATNAAERERQRIARDLHDSVIQPYLGLQFKLAALRHKSAPAGQVPLEEIESLYEMTVREIKGLRGFVRGLREAQVGRDDFFTALRNYTAEFSEHYGVDIRVESDPSLRINDRLAAELIQMAFEGMSNIRKHTRAERGTIRLSSGANSLIMSIENEAADGDGADFTPRSIFDRAQDLGGHARVERTPDGITLVRIEIPL